MKRRNFIGKLFRIGTGVAATAVAAPVIAKAKGKEKTQETFTIEDAFIQPYDGNKDLYYIKKNSLLNQELMKAIGDHYLPREKFGNYLPVFNQYVPVKDEYTIEDFRQLIMYLEDKRRNFDFFCDGEVMGEEVGLIRLIRQYRYHLKTGEKENLGYYKIDLFEAYKHGQYGPKD